MTDAQRRREASTHYLVVRHLKKDVVPFSSSTGEAMDRKAVRTQLLGDLTLAGKKGEAELLAITPQEARRLRRGTMDLLDDLNLDPTSLVDHRPRRDWLHFIGKSFYSTAGFVAEALEVGVSRAISRSMVGAFQVGDRVFVAFGDKNTPRRTTPNMGSLIFGYFTVDTFGLATTMETAQAIFPEQETEKPPTPVRVVRACGDYTDLGGLASELTSPEVAERLRAHKIPAFLCGQLTELIPPVRLRSVTSRWGYRYFDGVGFLKAHKTRTSKRLSSQPDYIEILGDFRLSPGSRALPIAPGLRLFDDYSQAELWARRGAQPKDAFDWREE